MRSRSILNSMLMLALLLTVGFSTALAQEQSNRQPFAAEDIFALEYANDVQVSPNGEHIVYVRHSNDIMQDSTRRSLWLVNVKSGEQTPLFADEYQHSSPRWSPDSKRIAFVSNQSGSNQIHVHWLAENKTARVSDLRSGPGNLTWSPNGKHLAFSMEVLAPVTDFARSVYRPKRPEGARWSEPAIISERAYYQADGRGFLESAYRHIFVVSSEGGAARQLTSGDYNHGGTLAWLPDSTAIVFSANRRDDWEYRGLEANLYQVEVADGRLTELTNESGRQTSPAFSPDGRSLVFLHSSGERKPYRNAKLRVMNWRNKEVTELLTDFDRSVESPAWLNGNTIVFQYADRGQLKLARVSARGGRISDLTSDVGTGSNGRPYLGGMFSASGDGVVAFTHGNAHQLGNVGVWQGGNAQVLTRLNEDLFSQRELGEVHEITYNSSIDNTEIHGWYITPPGFDPEKEYPLLVEIHGGPHLAYGPYFAAELQRYAAAGYVVFYNNYRGSSSYGKDFAMLLDGKYSSPDDFADHMSGVDAMIAKGFIDEQNLFITGGSAGGIATAYAVGLTDRFNAAVATNPVINWVSKVLTADSYLGQIANQFPGMPWEEHEHYWQRSPLSLVGNVTTPTLMFVGESDRRTPLSDSQQFYQALKLQGVDTALVRVPGAYHGVSGRPSRMIMKIEHALAWFEQYKK
ncbi:dipeptidyl aminopeptidase/acylaminoacyl peptidase [Idiomarina sp. A28L]|uniref:alpha/beta hydrolase family protein n=1 Tax=Idiomarina sp. A28L TaxID=1036674 RepID=UPI000213868F|nr:S9 family peptidase [Idiomarina sp. A28L]EGN74197.1 dipeptidyl aminopeptidase/acylaminoacyl peptidase [Idiomarina sp. A28L]